MNDRCRQLARQSRLDVYGLGTDNAKWEAALDRFGQALIQECLLALEPNSMSSEIDYDVEEKFYKRSAAKIQKHFDL